MLTSVLSFLCTDKWTNLLSKTISYLMLGRFGKRGNDETIKNMKVFHFMVLIEHYLCCYPFLLKLLYTYLFHMNNTWKSGTLARVLGLSILLQLKWISYSRSIFTIILDVNCKKFGFYRFYEMIDPSLNLAVFSVSGNKIAKS